MTQTVTVLVLSNELDPWAFVRPFTTLHPWAMVELFVFASAGVAAPKWRYGVFAAAIVAPLSVIASFLPWHLPLSAIAALNAAHFAVLLATFSVAFGLSRYLARRMVDR